MIKYTTGDLLSESTEALVNTVNCIGVMGRGIALQFKKRFPENFKAYAAACAGQKVQPGQMFVFEVQQQQLSGPRFIINFPTKRHWRHRSRIVDIEAGLVALVAEIQARGIHSIALPPLGSGLGGLEWAAVKTRIEAAMQAIPNVKVLVFEPRAASKGERSFRTQTVPKMTSTRAVLVTQIQRYLRGLLDPFVTLLELHKLMYFMEKAGEPLNLGFVKGRYGPYAEKLRHVLNAVEGHMVSGYADGGDAPTKILELVPGALQDAHTFLNGQAETQARLKRVSDLVDGFESSYGLELLATVHWILDSTPNLSTPEVVRQVHTWNAHKKQFTERQIYLATTVLVNQGWVVEAAV